MHQLCLRQWPQLADHLRTLPTSEWPNVLDAWLPQHGELSPVGGSSANGANAASVAKLGAALAIVNSLGRLHRQQTASTRDAFRRARDQIIKKLQLCLTPQEIFTVLDAADLEGRHLASTFVTGHAA
jgi:hypothetical protein